MVVLNQRLLRLLVLFWFFQSVVIIVVNLYYSVNASKTANSIILMQI